MGHTDTMSTFNPLEPLFHRTRHSIYSTLAHYDKQMRLQPELAEKWDFAADNKTVTFKLRQGVKFHSGREFTSADVKFTAEYAATNERVLLRPLYRMVTGVETPDKYTVSFKLSSPNAGIYDLIDTLSIIDSESVKDSASVGIGTGPFKLDKYLPNDRVEMVAFKDYWDKGKPYVDKLVSRIIPDPTALTINLESGALDCAWRVSYPDAARLKSAGSKFAVDPGSGGYIFNIAINVKLEPFTNKKVRQAIAWSIDRARFCRTVQQGLVEASCLIWPRNSWAYLGDLEGSIGFDLDKAKALLREAGLEKGFETEIMTSSKLQYGLGDLAVILQADLKKIGINAKVSDLETAQYGARRDKGDIALMAHTYGRANRDPAGTLTMAKSWYTEKEQAWTHFESAEYDKLRQEMQQTLEQEKRIPIARKVQQLALDECFTNPIAGAPVVWAYASHVKGLWYDMDDALYGSEVWLDR